MLEVQFHVNVPDRMRYTCRMLRKALRQRTRVAVTGPAADLNLLDQTLWTFEADAFLPHLRIGAPAQEPVADQAGNFAAVPVTDPIKEAAVRARTPLWLVDDAHVGSELGVLVNLGAELAPGFEKYQRLIEIVGDDDASRVAGRNRWRQYLAMGYTPLKYEAMA